MYRALDKRTGLPVAVKFLKKVYTRETAARESILSEMEFGVRLDHPALVRLHGIGTTPNGGLFLAMDYLPGGNLSERLCENRPELSLVKDWLAALIDGLEYAHSQGIIHCDLKPANVLFDADGRPHIADFGLAQRLTCSWDRRRGGTPAYLAPELLDPTFGNPGPWTDVFGLGAITFEILTGRPTFAGETAAAVLSQVVSNQPVVWPDGWDGPPAWREFCERCLLKPTKSRWPLAEVRKGLNELP